MDRCKVSNSAGSIRLSSFTNLSDASRVDSNRPTGASGKGDAKGREHAHRRNIDTVGTRQVVGGQDGGNDEEGARQSGDHADTEASDDDGGRSGLASSGDGLDEGEGARREALGGLADQHTYEKADDDAAKYFPASFCAVSKASMTTRQMKIMERMEAVDGPLVQGKHQLKLVQGDNGNDESDEKFEKI